MEVSTTICTRSRRDPSPGGSGRQPAGRAAAILARAGRHGSACGAVDWPLSIAGLGRAVARFRCRCGRWGDRPDGMPITWWLAFPKLSEHEVCLELLAQAGEPHRPNPTRCFRPSREALLALAASLWHHWASGSHDQRSLITYNH